MLDGINTEVDIEIRPIEVTWAWLLNIKHFSDRSVFEPRKIFVSQKVLVVIR